LSLETRRFGYSSMSSAATSDIAASPPPQWREGVLIGDGSRDQWTSSKKGSIQGESASLPLKEGFIGESVLQVTDAWGNQDTLKLRRSDSPILSWTSRAAIAKIAVASSRQSATR
jgi:hypothetical protein